METANDAFLMQERTDHESKFPKATDGRVKAKVPLKNHNIPRFGGQFHFT